jgi:hypothetical protein
MPITCLVIDHHGRAGGRTRGHDRCRLPTRMKLTNDPPPELAA